MRKSFPGRLADEIRSELARLGGSPSNGGDLSQLIDVWPRCVGSAIADNAWPARFTRDGSLVVHVSSSTWAFELTQLEGEIRARLGELAPKQLKFVPGPLPEGEGSQPKPTAVRANISTETREKANALAAEIADPALRELVAKAASLSLSRSGEGYEATGLSGRLERP